jgi:hypothetical protein
VSFVFRLLLAISYSLFIASTGTLILALEGRYYMSIAVDKFFRRLAATRRKLVDKIETKGWHRLTDIAVLGMLVFIIVGGSGSIGSSGWLFSLLVDSAQIALGSVSLYWLGRKITHTRTHDIKDDKLRYQRESVLLLCLAIIIGLAFS